LFWILPRRRNLELLRLLVAYELIWDLLDNMSERAAAIGQIDGYQLHLAIAEAIDPSCPISDYYADHPWREDGGYLRGLVEFCRERCAALPSYLAIRDFILAGAARAQVLALNHDPVDARRDRSLERWVASHFPGEHELDWWELSASASAPLTIHALLSLASEPDCCAEEIVAVHDVYFWVSAATTMLDSYADQDDDGANGDHSYVAHYPSQECALRGVERLFARAAAEARALPRGRRHAIIAAGMGAMYLSKEGAPTLSRRRRLLADAGGSLTRLLLPVLRGWRVAYAQGHA
jgi:tetraprenyl-beta-curcumene synthase